MMSKSLFFKRLKQDAEQRIWFPVIFFIIGFLSLEIALVSRVDMWQGRSEFAQRLLNYLLNNFFAAENSFTMLTILMAVVGGLSGFSYIHSSKKLDVYHSIPIKRERLFLQQYVYGVLYYLIPLLLHALLCVGIGVANGVSGLVLLGQALGFVLVQLLIYLVCYSVVIVSVLLTGNIIIAVMGSGVLLFYSMIIATIKALLVDKFLVTSYVVETQMDIVAFSPIHLIINMINHMTEGKAEFLVYTDYMGDYVKLILMAAAYTAIALFLYKKRPTEAAGKTMAFAITEPVVKAMIAVPGVFLCGYIFTGITYNSNDFGWFVFGCIFGFIIICPLMEIIFRRDLKALLHHPLQLVFNGVLIAGIIVVLRFDVLGYDTYIPDEDKVESYAVGIDDLGNIYIPHDSSMEYKFENMTIQKHESTRKLLEHAVELTRPVRTNQRMDGEEHYYTGMVVKYNLKNGKEVYRSYLIDVGDPQVVEWLGDMYENMQYKVGTYPILNETWNTDYIGVMLDFGYTQENLALSADKMERLVAAYKEELGKLTFDEIMEEFPVANISFAKGQPEETTHKEAYVSTRAYVDEFDFYSEESGYRIYPSFTQTLALLEEFGVQTAFQPSVEHVVGIRVEYYFYGEDEFGGYRSENGTWEYLSQEGEQEQIAQLLPCLIPCQLADSVSFSGKVEENIDVHITYGYEGEEEFEYCNVKKGMLPEFLKEQIK